MAEMPKNRSVGDISLKDKVVVVTGGGSGIDLAFVHLALVHGAKVVVGDLKLTEDAEELFEKTSKDVLRFKETDVTRWSELKELVEEAESTFGDVPDIYVAGAGIYEPPWSSFWENAEDEKYEEVEINLNHVVKLARIAMRSLLGANKTGVFLSIASGAGIISMYSAPLYTATKHAVVGFTRSMALAEAFEGIKFVTICPGPCRTPIWRKEHTSQWNFPMLTAEEVAIPMIELITQGKYGGGTVLSVDKTQQDVDIKVVPEWNIEPLNYFAKLMLEYSPEKMGIPPFFQPMKDITDSERKVKK